ncbi:MAG: LysR family transcriptional regulator [Pontibacterium sp.]
MNPSQLQAFVAVVEHGSFRAAAEQLFKTQPAVSNAINSLEGKFGFRLFNREHYRPVLTPEGKAFYKQAKQLLAKLNQLEQVGYALADGLAPKLSVCLSSMSGHLTELQLLRAFTTEHPKVELCLSSAHLHGVLKQLETEQADLAIGPRYGLTDQHEYIELSTVKMVTVMAPSLVNAHKGVFSQREISRHPHILIENTESPLIEHINVLPFGRRWYVNDYQVKKTLLLSGLGWARIPEDMIRAELAQGTLKRIEVEQFTSHNVLPIYLIRRRHIPMSEQARTFWKYVENNEGGF